MSADTQRSGINVLVADDDDQNARLLVRILEQGGYEGVLHTTDSSTVLELCRTERPDLLLLDIAMPAPTGFDILEALASEEDAPVAVMLTGHEHPSIERRAADLGAAAVIGKTTSRDEMLATLDSVLATDRTESPEG